LGGLDARDQPKTFSEAERDRRWSETRARMQHNGIDVLVFPGSYGRWHARYLSQLDAGQDFVALVFPARGSPIALAYAFLPTTSVGWISDVRPDYRGGDGEAIVKVLRELQLANGRIGIPFLELARKNPLPFEVLQTLANELPAASLVDCEFLMREQLAVKSPEEIAMIERACAVAERGIFELGYHVRSGMTHREAATLLEAAILRAGSERAFELRWECAETPVGRFEPASDAPISRRDVIQAEIRPTIEGYGCQEVHPICVGKPAQRIYEMFDFSAQVLTTAISSMKTGAWLGQIEGEAMPRGEEIPYQARLNTVSCGLMEDMPDWTTYGPLKVGHVFTLKSTVKDTDGTTVTVCTAVAVTPDGGRRLSKRPLELMLTSRSFLSSHVDWRAPEPTAPWLSPS
jgi:Xaa-Pro aminopeptidase